MIWNWDLTTVETEQSSARFSFEVRLFNAGASPTTLHRPYLVFSRKDGTREAASILRDSTSSTQLMELNLPAQGGVQDRRAGGFSPASGGTPLQLNLSERMSGREDIGDPLMA
jgi:hypothetical protein